MSSAGAGASEGVAREALERNLWALWSRFGRGDECALHEEEDSLFFDTPIPTLPYNGVLRFLVASDVDRRMDAIFEHYRQRDVPFFWIVHPSAQPSDLGERLSVRGLEEAEVLPGMAMDLGGLAEPAAPPEGIRVHEAGASDTEDVLELAAWRWNVPGEVVPELPGSTASPRSRKRGVWDWRGFSPSRPFTRRETPDTTSAYFTRHQWPWPCMRRSAFGRSRPSGSSRRHEPFTCERQTQALLGMA